MSVTNYNLTNYSTSSSMTKAAASTSTSSSSKTTKSSSTGNSLTADDFLKLFVKELQNQDSTNPMDSTEMMSQITQLSNMQMMQSMANYSKSNYAVSLVGKYVKATVTASDGSETAITGTIDRVTQKNGEYTFYVGDKSFTSDEITEVTTAPASTSTDTTKTTESKT